MTGSHPTVSPETGKALIYFVSLASQAEPAVILLSCAAMAQNDAAIEKAESACGPGQIHFDVDATNYTESIAQPTNGKAFVFVIAQSKIIPFVSD